MKLFNIIKSMYRLLQKKVDRTSYDNYLEDKVNYDRQEVFDCNKGIVYVNQTLYVPEFGRQSLEKVVIKS